MFEVNCFYCAKDDLRRIHYLWVLQLAQSGTALRGVVYDHSFCMVARRWFRVQTLITRGSFPPYPQVSKALTSNSLVFSELDKLVQNSCCIPPTEVLDYFRNRE